jgi:hypothetical protein
MKYLRYKFISYKLNNNFAWKTKYKNKQWLYKNVETIL